MLVRDFDQRLGVGLHAGRCLGVHERDHAHVRVLLQRVFELVRVYRLAPGILHHDRNPAAALHVLDHAAAEHTVAANDHLVAGRDQVHEAVLHAHRAGAGDRKGQGILGLKGVAEQSLQFLHHFDEDRIEISNGRQAHGRHDARVDLGRTGAHQGALGRMEGMDSLSRAVGVHVVVSCEGGSKKTVFFTARLEPDRLARVGFVQYLRGGDSAFGQAFDLHRPPRGHVARLDPVADHGAVNAEAARNFGLAAEEGNKAFSAIHRVERERRESARSESLPYQTDFDKLDLP